MTNLEKMIAYSNENFSELFESAKSKIVPDDFRDQEECDEILAEIDALQSLTAESEPSRRFMRELDRVAECTVNRTVKEMFDMYYALAYHL